MSADRILSQLLGGSAAPGFAGGLAGGLASGLLTSKTGRKFGKKALKVGGIAAVGDLAYAAWSRSQQRASGAPSVGAGAIPTPSPIERFVPGPAEKPVSVTLGLTLLRAMVAAAHADGKLDGVERHAIYEHVGALELTEVEKSHLLAQLSSPVDMNTLVATATSPEVAAEIYTASLLAIDVDTATERAYLAMLAARLELPESFVDSIHQELDLPMLDGESLPPAQRVAV